MMQHKRKKPWFKDITEFRILELDSLEDRLTAETVLILKHRPAENKTIKLGFSKGGKLHELQFLRTRRSY